MNAANLYLAYEVYQVAKFATNVYYNVVVPVHDAYKLARNTLDYLRPVTPAAPAAAVLRESGDWLVVETQSQTQTPESSESESS